jgi:hypothetical protein
MMETIRPVVPSDAEAIAVAVSIGGLGSKRAAVKTADRPR